MCGSVHLCADECLCIECPAYFYCDMCEREKYETVVYAI